MKFVANTVSKPVVGKEAKRLSSALKKGEHVITPAGQRTLERILARRAQEGL